MYMKCHFLSLQVPPTLFFNTVVLTTGQYNLTSRVCEVKGVRSPGPSPRLQPPQTSLRLRPDLEVTPGSRLSRHFSRRVSFLVHVSIVHQ